MTMPRPPAHDTAALLQDLADIWRCKVADLSCGKETLLQRLWAGYGTVNEVTVRRKDTGTSHAVVIKRVRPPAGSGVSHTRKLKSYQVEVAFYRDLAPRLLSSGVCAVAQPLSVCCAGDKDVRLALTDLRKEFPASADELNLEQARAALTWLAAFHAFSWERKRPAGLWEEGCYWYLRTRLEEYDNMDSKHQRLKAAAHELDRRLRSERPDGSKDPRFRTVVHGDFKSANLLFSARAPVSCAAFDFQYCGEGYGARDVAKLLACSVQRRVLGQHEASLLRHYHAALVDRLSAEQAAAYTFDVFQDHFDVSVADFVRFMAGWGWWGDVAWANRKTEAVLDRLAAEV